MSRTLTLVLLATAAAAATGRGSAAKVVHSRFFIEQRLVAVRQPLLAGEVQVVAYSSSGVRICPPYADPLVYRPPRVPACKSGLPVTGVDVSALDRQEKGKPARWSYLYLVGRYAHGAFAVTSQRQSAPRTRGHDPFAKVPCPTPRGGWVLKRSSAQLEAVNHYRRLTGHRDIMSLAYFDRGSILTLASTNPARTRAVVGRYGPRQLCVVKARYGPGVVARVRHRIRHLLGVVFKPNAGQWGWPTGGAGIGVSPGGQPTTSLEVLIVTPKLRAYLRRQPPGIVVVDASLRPVARG